MTAGWTTKAKAAGVKEIIKLIHAIIRHFVLFVQNVSPSVVFWNIDNEELQP